jgi:single-strand DNA-binding protein
VALSLTKGIRVLVSGRLEQRSSETEDGDRRFKVEIAADDIGVSLRFASTDVHKVLHPSAHEESVEPSPAS